MASIFLCVVKMVATPKKRHRATKCIELNNFRVGSTLLWTTTGSRRWVTADDDTQWAAAGGSGIQRAAA